MRRPRFSPCSEAGAHAVESMQCAHPHPHPCVALRCVALRCGLCVWSLCLCCWVDTKHTRTQMHTHASSLCYAGPACRYLYHGSV